MDEWSEKRVNLINDMIVLAILIPPLYFLIQRRWIGFTLTLLAMVFSTLLVVTMVMSPVIFIFWGIASIAAVLDLVYGKADRANQERLTHGKH